ncbi:hypothetical protein IFM89_019164 [Coptis chinensis]|uniref:Uncharacterized protein n=1 Tax=Coptis chinensis TaxID=261450 RepID=A0A835GYD6_9MAGN|nr:hypothetical protein IFM89_019164 [Coptis chinensis]
MLASLKMLPMKFVQKFGDELHDVVVLKVPPDGKRYSGNSDFHISIFDMTACEISYSRYLDYLEESNSGKETEEAKPGMLGFSINKNGDNSLEELADKPLGDHILKQLSQGDRLVKSK